MNETSPLLRAYIAIEDLEKRLREAERSLREPIAIVGMACRYPGGVRDSESFWRLLHDGVDAISEVPRERWDIDAYYDPNPDTPGKMYSRCGGFLRDLDCFDARFFGIAPREAVSVDPQQRLLLEVAWEALENAGQAPHRLARTKTGVFVGITGADFSHLNMRFGDICGIDPYRGTGSAPSVAPGRLSYVLGLQGPCMAVDTACSSSLVALHLACQSLRIGECGAALAGGVNTVLLPEGTIYFCNIRAMSPDGRCKTFDAAADGYVRGEGCGMVFLKRLSDALADGDTILALIRGSAINHDGPSGGLTIPNGPAQEAVIRAALANAGVTPAEVSYVESHGTGTALGDPIEIQALGNVLGKGSPKDHHFQIGSVKTNVGHLEAAAGMAGLMKVVLALQYKTIPPHLHFTKPNPLIAWDSLPVSVPIQPAPWLPGSSNGRRIAGLSAFGFSGTNAHVILEEAPVCEQTPIAVDRPQHVLTLSAKSEPALKELAARFEKYLATVPPASLADICYTANTGRTHFPHRLAVVAKTIADARNALIGVHGKVAINGRPNVTFIFTGEEPLASQYEIGQRWRTWGVEPAYVMGHGIGEYTAAVVAGVISAEDASKLADARNDLGKFEDIAGTVTYKPPRIGLVSTLTGELIRETPTAAYWRRQNEPVKFPEAMNTLRNQSCEVFQEIGLYPATDWSETLSDLAAMYMSGVEIDWNAFDRNYPRRKVSLPTYPFQRERYWPEGLESGYESRAIETDWLYNLQWEPQHPEPADTKALGAWLILTDQGGVGEALASSLEQRGAVCLRVQRDEEYWKILTQPLEGVVYLWALDEVDGSSACLHLLRLVQACARRDGKAPLLLIATRNVHFVSPPDDPAGLIAAQCWGLGSVIASEHPEFHCVRVDLTGTDTLPRQAQCMVNEICASGSEDQIAYRNNSRYVRRLERLSDPTVEKTPELHSDATYLITGGLGAIGIRVTEWLVVQGARHVVLMARTSPSNETRHKLEHLRQSGAQVVVAQGDVSSGTDVFRVLRDLSVSMPPLRGIIHAAGVLDDGILLEQNGERFSAVTAPKVAGAWNLHQYSLKLPLDFFVLFSSAASILGPPGQGNYAAANAYLDALAQYRRARGLPALSINWGPWSGAGMAAGGSDGGRARWKSRGIRNIASREGLELLGKLLSSEATQVIVMPVDWNEFVDNLPGGCAPPLLRSLVQRQKKEPTFFKMLSGAPPNRRWNVLLSQVTIQAAKALSLDPLLSIDPGQPLQELGMDSLMAVKIRNALGSMVGVPLPATLLFDHPTVEALAGFLSKEILSIDTPAVASANGAVAEAARTQAVQTIERLSDQEAESLLRMRLEAMDCGKPA